MYMVANTCNPSTEDLEEEELSSRTSRERGRREERINGREGGKKEGREGGREGTIRSILS
jgi:hypothetical protein